MQHRVERHEIIVYCMFIFIIDKCTLTAQRDKDFRDGYFLQPVTETSAKVNEENVLSGEKKCNPSQKRVSENEFGAYLNCTMDL